MPTSAQIRERVADLAWQQWSALGAGGWTDGKESLRAIDLELLVALSAWVGPDHPRVHAVATAWLHRYGNLLARPRMKHLLTNETHDMQAAVTSLLDTRPTTPLSARGKKNRTEVELPSLTHRADLCTLRARATLGVGARAEILRLLAHEPDHERTTLWLARYSSYSKRNVADATTMLELSGVVSRRRIANADTWSLTDPTTLRKLLGPFPRSAPSRPVALRVLRALEQQADTYHRHPGNAAITDALATMTQLREDLIDLRLAPLDLPAGSDHLDAYDRWSREVLQSLT